MKKFVLLDEGSNFIHSASFEGDFTKYDEIIQEVSEPDYLVLVKNLKFGADILIPFNDGEEFIIQYPSKHTMALADCEIEDVIGRSFNRIFPLMVDLKYTDVLTEVYKTGVPKKIKMMYYVDEILQQSIVKSVVKYNDFLVVLISNESDFDIIYEEEQRRFDNSLEGMAILQNGVTVRCNENHAKLLGAKVSDLIGRVFDFNKITVEGLTPAEVLHTFQMIVNRNLFSWEGIVRIRKDDGNYTTFRSICSPATFREKPAILISSVDISETKKIQDEALLLKENLETVQEITKLAIGNWDPINKFNWTTEIYSILEIDPESYSNDFDLIYNFAADEDKLLLENRFKDINEETNVFRKIIKVKTGKGNIKYLSNYSIGKFEDHNLVSIVGFIQDVSDVVNYEKELKLTLNKLENTLDEKKELLKELHHRVKNNLQIILSILNLDLRYSDDYEKILNSTVLRIQSMSLTHEQAYRSFDFAHINLNEYIKILINSLFNYYSVKDIEVHYDMSDLKLSMDTTISLGLIINELISNSIKFAFPNNEKGNLYISLNYDGEYVSLRICDDGIGLPDDIKEGKSVTLGLTIVSSLSKQIEAKLLVLDDCEGAGFKLLFKK